MPAEIIDLFCGIGGLTRGLIDSGLNVIAGFDIDPTCQFTYEHNNHVPYHIQNIREVHAGDLNEIYAPDVTRILVGCAPCQPFSQMRFKMGQANENDEKSIKNNTQIYIIENKEFQETVQKLLKKYGTITKILPMILMKMQQAFSMIIM